MDRPANSTPEHRSGSAASSTTRRLVAANHRRPAGLSRPPTRPRPSRVACRRTDELTSVRSYRLVGHRAVQVRRSAHEAAPSGCVAYGLAARRRSSGRGRPAARVEPTRPCHRHHRPPGWPNVMAGGQSGLAVCARHRGFAADEHPRTSSQLPNRRKVRSAQGGKTLAPHRGGNYWRGRVADRGSGGGTAVVCA